VTYNPKGFCMSVMFLGSIVFLERRAGLFERADVFGTPAPLVCQHSRAKKVPIFSPCEAFDEEST
jgi:hypothetical protein